MKYFIISLSLVFTYSLYALTDSDGNGISDIWELKHFGRIGLNSGSDSDSDSFSNFAESVAGTNPFHQNSYVRGDTNPETFESGVLDINGKHFTGANGELYIYYYWWGIAGKKYRPVWTQDIIHFYPYRDSNGSIIEFSPNTNGEIGFVVRIDKIDTNADDTPDSAYTYAPNVTPPVDPSPVAVASMQESLNTSGLIQSGLDHKPTIYLTMAGAWYGYFSRINFSIRGSGETIRASVLSDINLWGFVRAAQQNYRIEFSDCYLELDFAGMFSVYTMSEIESDSNILEYSNITDDMFSRFSDYLDKTKNVSESGYVIITKNLAKAEEAIVKFAMDTLHQAYDVNRQNYLTAYNNWETTYNQGIAQTLAVASVAQTQSDTNTPVEWYPDEASAIADRNLGNNHFVKIEISDIEESDGRTKSERLTMSANDINNNNILDSWEVAHFGHILSPLEISQSDADTDGIADIDEFKLGIIHTSDNTITYDNNSMIIGTQSSGLERDNEGNVTIHRNIN